MIKIIRRIKKRDGNIVKFDPDKISEAIWRSAKSVGGKDKILSEKLADLVIDEIEQKFVKEIPTVEEVQDIVERTLIKNEHAKTAKAYILYRQKRNNMRDEKAFLDRIAGVVDGYVQKNDWRVKENSNTSYAISGLQAHISGAIIAEYTLKNIYPKNVAKAHRNSEFHIHDLSIGTFAGYCAGWSLKQLLQVGFNGVAGRVAAKPAKHFNAALGQIVNFFGTLQNEWAGAQAFSSFDTYLAPIVHYDKLSYLEVKQSLQEFIFGINQTSRWGNQVPFTNITFDWVVPEDMKDQKVIVAGKELDVGYGEFQKELDLINKAFLEIMMEGDADGRIFTFPIPTYNITKDFDWDSENAQMLFEMTAKFGIPYFQNFVNSSLKPGDVRSMCCRLQLNVKELVQKTGGIFGAGEQTGSLGVVTINMPQLGYKYKTKEEFLKRLGELMDLAKESLEIKRKEVNKNMRQGLLPYTKRYLANLDHHFSTIGLNGMNECCMNFLGKENDIGTKKGKEFAVEVLKFMRDKLGEIQEETGHIYNLEATPAEGVSYRLAKHDRKNYPDILTAGTNSVPYYTNSTYLPVDYTNDVFEALDHQDELQALYSGGTVLHGFIGERISDWQTARELVKKVCQNYRLPYFSITPTFSVCPVHGYISGEHWECPHEHSEEDLNKYGVEVKQKIEVN
ncbi:MAG: ribonucleoside triphosphate reductase [Nanoarchaeota archaeon]|nr:ribonucleoside triphosphate reductase [Nanoarchaeota archaeon]